MKAREKKELLEVLERRFSQNLERHGGVDWDEVKDRLDADSSALEVLLEMGRTGGEPDVIARDEATGKVTFCDCAPESPTGRRSVCFDGAARAARKRHAPESSALEMAEAMGVELLTEEQYRQLQRLGEFDSKTSSWVVTPSEIRELGGALFCDRRYGRVFTYHNGAESYYAARGFRAILRV